MPSTAERKIIRKLQVRKHRWQLRRFVAEGPKVVNDLLAAGCRAEMLFSTHPENYPHPAKAVSAKELAALSQLSSPNQVLGVFHFPQYQAPRRGRVLILDAINDPGNLGTLIRTADWFGFRQVYCLPGTADAYGLKCVQSTMGSLGRVELIYASPEEVLPPLANYQLLRADLPGTELKAWKPQQEKPLALILGSESHGPSRFWQEYSTALYLPKRSDSPIDSLNVATAGAILMHALCDVDRP